MIVKLRAIILSGIFLYIENDEVLFAFICIFLFFFIVREGLSIVLCDFSLIYLFFGIFF